MGNSVMVDFNKQFLPTFEFSLKKIDYRMLDITDSSSEKKLNCTDIVHAELTDNSHVKIEYTRELQFETNDVFYLAVVFEAIFTIDEDSDLKIDWEKTDISSEFVKKPPEAFSIITSRTSLLIAQITSSYGQPPLITPPTFVRNED